jgi:UDP-N-acetylglucosamine transferase subunit ALG13
MIFVTVGNMDPFDRLIQAIDKWLAGHPGVEEVVAQIGAGNYQPANCEHVKFFTPTEYLSTFARARIVVSHAGMGTIITALELQKPIIIMPKQAVLGEQRNEHQLATVRHFRRSPRVLVADSEVELPTVLDGALASGICEAGAKIGTNETMNWPPDATLISFVHEFISRNNLK